MGMALLEPGAGDPDELPLFLQGRQCGTAAVTHTGPQAAHELVNRIGQGALVGHPALDPFRHQLFVILLEIPVLAAVRHSTEAAHPPVHLELASLIDLGVPRGFLAPGHQRPDHDGVGPGGDRFDNVAGIFDTAVRDDRNPIFRRHAGGVVNRGNLGHPDARHHPCGTDGAWADPHLDGVGTRFDQGGRGIGGGDVAGDERLYGL